MRKVTVPLIGYLCLAVMIVFSSANGNSQTCQNIGITVNDPVGKGVSPPIPQICGQFTSTPVACSSPNPNIRLDLCIDGISQGNSCFTALPPDVNAAVGDSQVVEFVNNAFLVLNKNDGTKVLGPVFDGSLFPSKANGGNGCYAGGNDVIVQWDKTNSHWLLSFHENSSGIQGRPLICIAVSQSSSAAGSYYTYEYDRTLTNVGSDYPKWGIWPTGYFQTLNEPTGICAYNSANLFNGTGSKQVCIPLQYSQDQQYNNDYIILPADVDSKFSVAPPPTGQDEFFIGSVGQGDPNCNNGTQNCNNLYLYSMHIDWNNPSEACVVGKSLAAPITVPPYKLLCPNSMFSNCIPQQGSGTQLEGLGRFAMYRFSYWNEGTGGQQLQHWFVNHVVSQPINVNTSVAAERWYEFQAPSSSAATISTLISRGYAQAATYMPGDTNHRWMGSIARDNSGNIALGYSESSSSMYPSMAIAIQLPTDSRNVLEPQEVPLLSQAGLGPNPTPGQDWGDYSSLAIDADGCTFWYANEYYDSKSTWHTRLTKFQFALCTHY
jgi:hypothetical protein